MPLGLKLEGHGAADPAPRSAPFTIGYLARICPEKGLHLLIQAFRELAERNAAPIRLRVAGYLGERDRAYHDGLVEQVRDWGLSDRIEFVEDRAGHDWRYAIDATKIMTELGYAPHETFETGLRRTQDWFLANEQWWKPLL